MSGDTAAPFLFPAVGRKKVIADFDGGRLASDAGVILLAAAERRRLGIADRLAGLIADPRNPALVHFDGVNDGRMLFPLFGPDRTDAAGSIQNCGVLIGLG